MPTRKDQLDRLKNIGQERVCLIARLQALETEQTAIISELAQSTAEASPAPTTEPADAVTTKPRRRKGVVPLPVGRSIKRAQLNELKAQVSAMDRTAFQTVGRAFIHEWYPRLAKTPHWHEISTALQQHFGASRQQVASYAAHIAREVGEAHVNAQAH